MSAVSHMKWSGWGREGVAFTAQDKPAFPAFIRDAIGLDVTTAPTTLLDMADVLIPASRIGNELLAALHTVLGTEDVICDDHDRLVHTYGKGIRDLLRIRRNTIGRSPDVVVYPADEHQVRGIVEAAASHGAVVIPFGGGSNIVGSLEPRTAETRPVISLDMGRLDRVLSIDEDSRLATIQAGAQGPAIEQQLQAHGWTLGHFPDSFIHSTLGGWVATRSVGMQSDSYGDIADMVRGLRMVRPKETVVLRPLPSTSTGPSVREMIIGSEGRLGVITEVSVQVHRLQTNRRILGYLFPSWEAGVEAIRQIGESDVRTTLARLSDAHETRFIFATRKKSGLAQSAISKTLTAVLRRRGWDVDQMCLAFLGFEGESASVNHDRHNARSIVRRLGGIAIGSGPGRLYDQKKFDTPYLRDYLLDRGVAADVSDTAAPWSALQPLCQEVRSVAQSAFADIGVQGWLMCHLAHSYHSGACLYFTFAFRHGPEPLPQYDTVKQAVQQAFVDHGGTVSHHHGVGVEHAPWLAQDISPAGAALIRGLFNSADPDGMFNPGKIIADEPSEATTFVSTQSCQTKAVPYR